MVSVGRVTWYVPHAQIQSYARLNRENGPEVATLCGFPNGLVC